MFCNCTFVAFDEATRVPVDAVGTRARAAGARDEEAAGAEGMTPPLLNQLISLALNEEYDKPYARP